MKTIIPLLLLLHSTSLLFAQSSTMRVYEILQENCVSCHNNLDPESGLDLEGAGATLEAKAQDVYSHLVDVSPANAYAAGQGYKYIYPGRPDKSLLFRKVNQGLDPAIELHADEGAPMPFYSNPISDLEKELIRQWVLFGAPASGTVVEEQLLVDYYDGAGDASFLTPPPAPDPSEGFQIKMGPFYLAPAGEPNDELEYFQKYELDLPEDLEVNRIDIRISGYSHHFILYNFTSQAAANNIPHGLRFESYHQDIGLFAAVQEATDLQLPEGTAFTWEEGLILDLNSHYINYQAGLVYQAETYINVYTQPVGTAAQEMQTSLLANTDIYIPNNGDLITETQVINYNLGEIYLWGVMGHTHQYGEDYKVYERILGNQGDLIYDGSCAQGIPGCVSPYFDYQHIPMRYFEPMRPLLMNTFNGIIHKASWINDGSEPVWFGPTSEDEMMVLVLMYTEDSTGVVIAGEHSIPASQEQEVAVYPNPVRGEALFSLPKGWQNATFRLYNAAGLLQREVRNIQGSEWTFLRGSLPDGMYIFQMEESSGKYTSGKLVFQQP